MVLLGGTAGNALASLGAIDKWISTLNSSVSGSARTGYKNAQVTFGGGTTRLERPVINGALGIQYAEQALNVGSVNIDFSQGQVVASTQYTHFALSGSQNAFFVYSDSPNYGPGSGTKFYYSRDGETHRDATGNLVNANGLYLVGSDGFGGVVAVNVPMTSNDPEGDIAARVDAGNLNLGGVNRLAHAFIDDLSSLKYSKFGGTIFETNPPTTVLGTNFRVSDPATASSGVRITGSALEASNVQLPSTTVELSLAQKIYNALVKVIQVDQGKIDSILNLIR